MLSFQSFGGAVIASSDGRPLGNAASQRRVIALISLAAAGGPKGITRDRAMALLWPETDTDRARHALSQTLYHVRTSLARPDLFLPGGDIRLNPAAIRVDAWEFDELFKAGHYVEAASLYHGEFLDGFFLPGSAEFEEWVTSLRRQFAAQAATALDRLAMSAEDRDDWAGAVEWRRRLASHDILSSRATLKLMEALVRSGDSAAAMQHADVHRRAVKAMLDAAPDASVIAFEAQVRAGSARGQEAVAPPPPFAEAPTPLPALSATEDRVTLPAPLRVLAGVLPARRAWLAATAASIIGVAWFGTTLLAGSTDLQKRIAITPFRISATDPGLNYLHEGMVDLLAARFLDESLSQAVDPGATMTAWRKLAGSADTDTRKALTLAHRVAATSVIMGTVVGGTDRVYVTASLLSVPTGAREAEVSVEGPIDSLTAIIDRLAGELLAAKYGEADRLAARTTGSLSALRAYLIGQAAYRRGEYLQASQQYELAIRADSQFALAAFQLALAFDRLNDGEQHDRALAIAWENKSELSVRDRAHLIAFAGPDFPRPSSAADALAAWEFALSLTPVRADIWYEFGERLFRQGNPLAVREAPMRAARAFSRALALDPTDREGARPMLVLAAVRTGDTNTVRRYASVAAMRDSMGALSPFIRWTVARTFGDQRTLARMRATFAQIDDENLRLIAMSSLYDALLMQDGERAANIVSRRASGSTEFDALLAQHAFALNSGDSYRALDVTEQIEERMPGVRAHFRLRILDALYSTGNRDAAIQAADVLERATRAGIRGSDFERAVLVADLCVLEQWRLAHGARARTSETVALLRTTPLPRVPIAIGTNPRACASMLEAWLAVEARQADAPARLLALDSLLLDGPATGDAATYAHILLARLHRQAGASDRALLAIRRRSYLTGWPRYIITARNGESILAAQGTHNTPTDTSRRPWF